MTIRNNIPSDATGFVHVISGGMDSTIALRLLLEKYDASKIHAISFDYGQKQVRELALASYTCENLGVSHKILDLSVLKEISKGFSANVDSDIKMPTIKDVIGDPAPVTEVPNRNMILMSIAAAYAQVNKCNYVVMGIQSHDEYMYADATQKFVDSVNACLIQHRKRRVQVVSPFSDLSKTEELELLLDLDGNLDLLNNTITCYNPDAYGRSCGNCPSCAERIQAFMNIGVQDPIKYSTKINWKVK